ncbi:DUF4259 domain-containing protein [Actinoplanes missouriensis]|uniref:DUF4259 domain-containing protein n=1 Tax=Actinoplanes missouriensis TaxID=1866 RepID=UPI0033D4E56C
MGTWGTGPFDSDAAEDFADRVEEIASEDRALLIRERLEGAALPGAETPHAEILAAAAIVVAGMPLGGNFSWNEDYPGISSWLEGADLGDLSLLAATALESCFAQDSWYWRSWATAEERIEAQGVVATLHRSLQT